MLKNKLKIIFKILDVKIIFKILDVKDCSELKYKIIRSSLKLIIFTYLFGLMNTFWFNNELIVRNVEFNFVKDENVLSDDGKINVNPIYMDNKGVTVKWTYKVTIQGTGVISKAYIFYPNEIDEDTLFPVELELTNSFFKEILCRVFNAVPNRIDEVTVGLSFTSDDVKNNSDKNLYLCLQDKESKSFIIYLIKIKYDKNTKPTIIDTNEILRAMQYQKIDSKDYEKDRILSLENTKIKKELKEVREYLDVLN